MSGQHGDATLFLNMDAAMGAVLRHCDQHWDELVGLIQPKVSAHPGLSAAWETLVRSAGWPSRLRLRQCVDQNDVALIVPLIELLRDCGRSSSRAHLSLLEFTQGVQLVADEVTRWLLTHEQSSSRLGEMLGAVQRCATVACLIMSRESQSDESSGGSKRRQLADAETKFTSLWESGLLGVLVCDFHGNIREANDGFLQTFGFTREELRAGQVRWNQMTPAEWQHLDENAIAQLNATGRAKPWEKEYFNKAGARVPVLVGVSVLNEEETIAFVLDITERRHVEALRERSKELEAENRRVQEASRLKGEFLANMSHELRTPLTAITGFAELLLNGDVTPDSAEHSDFLRDILSAGLHLQRLISEVLDLAKIEAGSLQFNHETIDVRSVIDEVCGVLRNVANERGIEVRTTVEVGQVTVDPGRLKQVLYNYLSNALKFSARGSTVEVSATNEPGDKFRVEVVDHGIGIAAADIGRLFREFQQLESGTAKRHQGTGLGLALTKRLVEAQGGTVGVESELGLGSRFFAVLPKNGGSPTQPPEVPSPSVAPEAGSILVVEDDPNDRNLLLRILSEAGYRTQAASTGRAALASCEAQVFDAVTLDLLLPDMTGLQVLQRIRQVEGNRDTPVVIVSVVAEQGVVRGFPVHDYLTKPIDSQALVRSLRTVISRVDKGVILVIDDDEGARRLMEAALTTLGYPVVCVQDGQAGLDFVAHTRPVGIVLDLLMPRMDGFEFLTRFRRDATHDHVPVVVWTTKDLTRADKESLARFAQGTIQKGESAPADLVAELGRLIGKTTRSITEGS